VTDAGSLADGPESKDGSDTPGQAQANWMADGPESKDGSDALGQAQTNWMADDSEEGDDSDAPVGVEIGSMADESPEGSDALARAVARSIADDAGDRGGSCTLVQKAKVTRRDGAGHRAEVSPTVWIGERTFCANLPTSRSHSK
jgi:hypothetical protein